MPHLSLPYRINGHVVGVFTASPIAGDGKVYFVRETGETIVLKAGRTFEVISRKMVTLWPHQRPLAASCSCAPTIACSL